MNVVDTDLDLYRRGMATAVACWTSYARAIPGAEVHRLPRVDVAVFTDGPERDVFNNAVLAHGLGAQERRVAVDALVRTYADAGITSYAAWVHETDTAMLTELTGRGFVHQETTRDGAFARPGDRGEPRGRRRRDVGGVPAGARAPARPARARRPR